MGIKIKYFVERRSLIGNYKGQSAVEYVLLLLVIVAMVSAVYSNKRFKEFFGNDSGFFLSLKSRMEYSYRYGMSGVSNQNSGDNYGDKHESYYNTEESDTHFFTPVSSYLSQ